MSPGGHLLTTLAACAASAALSESVPLTLGIAAGGFLIDVDHAIDYVVFEKQRDLRPESFLRYYIEGRVQRAVLMLHSYELFTLLGVLAWLVDALPLSGYLMGALMHLALDVIFNREFTPRSISAFYSFSYRLAHGFRMDQLFGKPDVVAPPGFWSAFFRGPQPVAPPAPDRLQNVHAVLR